MLWNSLTPECSKITVGVHSFNKSQFQSIGSKSQAWIDNNPTDHNTFLLVSMTMTYFQGHGYLKKISQSCIYFLNKFWSGCA